MARSACTTPSPGAATGRRRGISNERRAPSGSAPGPATTRCSRWRAAGPSTGRVRVPGDKSVSHRALLLGALGGGGVGGAGTVRRRRRGAHGGGSARPRGAARARPRLRGDGGLGTTVVSGGPTPCTSRTGRSTWATRAPPCDCSPAWWRACPFTTELDRRRVVVEPAHGPRGGAPAPDGGHGRGAQRTLPASAHHPGRRPAGHRLHDAHGERPGEVVRAPGRARMRRARRSCASRCSPGATPRRCSCAAAVHAHRGGRPRRRARGAARARRHWQRFELDVPGDPSQAAFWVVAACVVPGSEITVERVYVGPGRRGFLDVLPAWGRASTRFPPPGPATSPPPPTSWPAFGPLHGTEVARARRSQASTRSPCWRWRPRVRRATRCFVTSGSCA